MQTAMNEIDACRSIHLEQQPLTFRCIFCGTFPMCIPSFSMIHLSTMVQYHLTISVPLPIIRNRNFQAHLQTMSSTVVKCDHSAHSLASHGNYSWFTARAISSLRINKNCMSILLLLLPKVSNE